MSLRSYETSVAIGGLFYNIYLLYMMKGPNKYIELKHKKRKHNKNRVYCDNIFVKRSIPTACFAHKGINSWHDISWQENKGNPKMKFLRLFLSAVRRPPILPTIKTSLDIAPVRRPTWGQYSGVNPIQWGKTL